MVVLARHEEYIVDLIQYSDKEISHLKRLVLEYQTSVNSKIRQNLYFNRAKDILYLLNEYEDEKKREIIAYDFDGDELFQHHLDNSGIVDHIDNNLFLAWTWAPSPVQVFNVTEDGMNTMWDFQIDEVNFQINVLSYKLIRGLGSMFFERQHSGGFSERDKDHIRLL